MAQEQMIFKKVALSQRKAIFRELAQKNIQVLVKSNEQIFHLIAKQTEKDEVLLCHHTQDSKVIEGHHKVMVQFVYEEHRYFLQTELKVELGWVVINTNQELFQLQRRSNTRVDIPEGYLAEFTITSFDSKAYFQASSLKDISAGGFRAEIQGEFPDLKIGDPIKGMLKLGSRRALELQVEVRFVMKNEKQNQVMGVQILNVDPGMESRLLMLMMDLQREFYLKYSGE
ncbi:hypothetical protein BDW_09795 [Bdellovibrio bacteriovorus W]|nr:hypothetical protein BDW_09795 [Bdellovibrio bacteriovorus W]